MEEADDPEQKDEGVDISDQNEVREVDEIEEKCDNNNIAENETNEETSMAEVGAATAAAAAAAAGVATASSTNGNGGIAKSTLKYNPIGEEYQNRLNQISVHGDQPMSRSLNNGHLCNKNISISGPDVFLETGKVVGQNSTRMAGQVIVGVSAAFLVWDVVDLGWTVSDLIRLGMIDFVISLPCQVEHIPP